MVNTNDHSGNIALFLGGGQSGKSYFAENCAKKWNRVLFYATGGQIENSPEWSLRIKKHKDRRPSHWTTIEHPVGLEEVLNHCQDNKFDVLLIDCLTLWMGWQVAQNIQNYSQLQLLAHLETESLYFIKQLSTLKCPILVVSNEVGEGVIPGNESGRIFREALGAMNFILGEQAKCVTFSIAGQTLLLKSPNLKMNHGFCPIGLVNENYIFTELMQESKTGEINECR